MKDIHPFIRQVANGTTGEHPLIGVSPGSGHITQTAVRAGVDVFFVFSAGYYRTSGVGALASFLAYGNTNDITEELLKKHILPHSGQTPIAAGMMPNDPVMATKYRLERLRNLGVGAIINWPASGLTDAVMKQMMQQEGLTLAAELEMLLEAQKMGFATFGFAHTPEEVQRFCEIGVDGLILGLGLTHDITATMEKKNQIHETIRIARAMWNIVKDLQAIPLSFLYGGSIIQPADLEDILREVPLHGYAGGSAFERIPVTNIVETTIQRLKSVPRSYIARKVHKSSKKSILIGESHQIKHVRNLVKRTAPHDVNVCIMGETGTGKELVANALHMESSRCDMPFITMNCGAIPDALVESEFFGHEIGAFTGANKLRLGNFALANHGTLFLDEIGDLCPHGQAALLRAIQQGEIQRVGAQRLIRVDVRIIAAASPTLKHKVLAGIFRTDLFYRINSMLIHTPPLREIPSDIPLIVQHLLQQLELRFGRRFIGITDNFRKRLLAHSWIGNVRELEQVLTQAILLEDGEVLTGKNISLVSPQQDLPSESTDSGFHREMLAILEKCDGNKSMAARKMGVSRKTLYSWLAKSSGPPKT